MKILHIASFTGNIGDNASHFGLQSILNNFFMDRKLDVHRLEIRRFYKNYSLSDKLFFNKSFVKLANKNDLLIIGGGGFLDYWVEDSQTGTTIDIHPDLLKEIKIPILFSSVGALPHKTIPEGNIIKFKKFLDTAYENENITFAMRNDGSIENIRDVFGSNYSNNMYSICDNAFFFRPHESEYNLIEKPYVVINTTTDQLLMQNKYIGTIDSTQYVKSMVKFVNYLIDKTELTILFVPHIYKDLYAIQKIADHINDFHIRTRVRIAPFLSEDSGTLKQFLLYQKSELNIGMRFHANICSLGLRTLSVGLAALDRVVNMYESIGIDNQSYVSVDHDFAEELIEKVKSMLTNKNEILRKRDHLVTEAQSNTMKQYAEIFRNIL